MNLQDCTVVVPTREVDTLIVSDVHLGSDLSRPDALLATLRQYTFQRLILLGDIFDDLNVHWEDQLSQHRLLDREAGNLYYSGRPQRRTE